MWNNSKKKEALREVTADQVKAMILNGSYAPGDPIRECDIAKKLNVSRMPVREVFRVLEKEGLVEYIPNCGVRVKKLTKRDIQEIYSTRLMLDLFIIDDVFANITAADIAELKLLTQRMAERENCSLCNELFHHKLVTLSGNSRFFHLWNMMENQLRLIMNTCSSSDYLHQLSVPLHKKIVEALEQADKKAYEEAVRNHTEIALENLLQHCDEQS